MASAIRESVYGPNNRVIGAQLQATLYYEHDFENRTPFNGVYPWRSYKGLPAFSTRSTKYTYTDYSGGKQTQTFLNQILIDPNDAFARRTTLGATETSSYYPRQGELTEVVYNTQNPRSSFGGGIKPDAKVSAAFGASYPNREAVDLYANRDSYKEGVAKRKKFFVNFLETAKKKNLDALLDPVYTVGRSPVYSNLPPAMESGAISQYYDVHHVYSPQLQDKVRPVSLVVAEQNNYATVSSSITDVPVAIPQDYGYGLHTRDTTGTVTDSEPGLFYSTPIAVPVTQNLSGMLGSTVYGDALPIMFSPKVVSGARKWYLLFQMRGVYEEEPIYKYYNGLRYALDKLGQTALNTQAFKNSELENGRQAVCPFFFTLYNATFAQLMTEYPYAAQDSDLSKATTRFSDNWDFSVAGEWTVGNMSLHQFWSVPVEDYAAAYGTGPTVTELAEMASKTLTVSFSGLSDTTVITEAPKQTWQKGKAYRSTHLARKSATTIVHTVVEYFVVDAYVKQGESQKTFLGFIAYRSRRFDRKGDDCVLGIGKLNRWMSADVYLNARHFDGLTLLPAAHAEAALRPHPYYWTGHSYSVNDLGFGEYEVTFSRTLSRADRYSNYFFRNTLSGVVGQAYTVTTVGNPGRSLAENSHVSGTYYSHRYYLDGDELKAQAPYLPTPLAWSYSVAYGPTTNSISHTGVTTLPSIVVTKPDGSFSSVSCLSSFLSISSGAPPWSLTVSAGTKTYSAPLVKVQDFTITPDPSLSVLTGRNGRAESQPQVLKRGADELGVLTTRRTNLVYPFTSYSFLFQYEAVGGAVSDTLGAPITSRRQGVALSTVSGIFRAVSSGYDDSPLNWSTGYTFVDRATGGVYDISPYNNIYQNYTKQWLPDLTSQQVPWVESLDAPSQFALSLSLGQNFPIVTASSYSETPIFNVGTQRAASASGFHLWPITEDTADRGYAPNVIDHGIYCHYEYPNNNKYAVVYWKPGADIAWRIANPFLLDGAKMPSLAEIEALVSQDAAALDAHYSFFTTDQTTLYTQAVSAYNAQSGHPSFTKFQKPPSQYPIQYATKRTTEWGTVKAELLNLKTVWTNTKLASEGGDDTDRDNKIALRKTAAEKLWKAVRVIVYNNFLSESFFLKHPVKDRTCIVEDKDVVDQLRA